MARRALILLDGIDEGGKRRAEIERHVVEVLAPQGHVMLVTSRPNGLREELFREHFVHVKLEPLSDAQQRTVIERRVGKGERAERLVEYVRERVPLDGQTGRRVTGNPLMLSMVVSIFESRQGSDAVAGAMPGTVAELYDVASRTMLERVDRKERGAAASAAAVPHLTGLLEAMLFEAHVAQTRIIDDAHLTRAALGMFAPERLAALDAEYSDPFKRFEGRAEKGHYVEVVKEGEWKGRRGVICEDDGSSNPYKVKLTNGPTTGWLYPKDLVSSGMDEAACLKQLAEREAERVAAALRAASEALPSEAKDALRAVRERVGQDRLPLLSLLEAEPLRMQSSHLSFQEYFAAHAICTGAYRLPEGSPPPWQWPAWWANAVRLGGEMGDEFRRGLLKAAGVAGVALDLKGKLGGDRPTVLAVVAQLMRAASLSSINLSDNSLRPEGAKALAPAIRDSASVTKISLAQNMLGEEGTKTICEAVGGNKVLKELDLSGSYASNIGGAAGAKHVGAMLRVTASVTSVRAAVGW